MKLMLILLYSKRYIFRDTLLPSHIKTTSPDTFDKNHYSTLVKNRGYFSNIHR